MYIIVPWLSPASEIALMFGVPHEHRSAADMHCAAHHAFLLRCAGDEPDVRDGKNLRRLALD